MTLDQRSGDISHTNRCGVSLIGREIGDCKHHLWMPLTQSPNISVSSLISLFARGILAFDLHRSNYHSFSYFLHNNKVKSFVSVGEINIPIGVGKPSRHIEFREIVAYLSVSMIHRSVPPISR